MSESSTPLMKQYEELKSQLSDGLLFFRMGDFYELFGEDAVLASRELSITLTSRDRNKPNPTPMAGVPHHSAESYIQKLLQRGYRVGIAEQTEDPSSSKGLVKREITRILTPGIQFQADSSEPRYFAVVLCHPKKHRPWTFAAMDCSAGDTYLQSYDQLPMLLSDLRNASIRHLQLPRSEAHFSKDWTPWPNTLVEHYDELILSQDKAQNLLRKHFSLANLDGFFQTPEEQWALAHLIQSVLQTQRVDHLSHLKLPQPLHQAKHMRLGPVTPDHLDLFEKSEGGLALFTLLSSRLSQIPTSMGQRRLRQWIRAPLADSFAIAERQSCVKALMDQPAPATILRGAIRTLYDLERIMGRITTRSASPRDTLALAQSLGTLPTILPALSAYPSNETLRGYAQMLHSVWQEVSTLVQSLTSLQIQPAPAHCREGRVFSKGFHAELDRLIDLTDNAESLLVEMEQAEKRRSGIPSLKIRYNRVFGYSIEITKTHLASVPDNYIRKQSMANAERFITPELKALEEEVLSAQMKRVELEKNLFEDLLQKLDGLGAPLSQAATVFSHLDCLLGFAQLAEQPLWRFPKIDTSLDLSIHKGRHPMVAAQVGGAFIPNSVELLRNEASTLLITGPNMGGKSTLMRQVALIILLGQMGAPVPAESAQWGVVSSIYTRMGGQDAITKGQSTFMVEMSELAHLLHYSDERSFLVLDEIGRGTSTYDGISVAWSTLEWITQKLRARTLFATHYHELVALETQVPGIRNAHLSVEESKESLRFLYELRPGPTGDSYGIQVAALAGLPSSVIQRSWQILQKLETQGTQKKGTRHEGPRQLAFF